MMPILDPGTVCVWSGLLVRFTAQLGPSGSGALVAAVLLAWRVAHSRSRPGGAAPLPWWVPATARVLVWGRREPRA